MITIYIDRLKDGENQLEFSIEELESCLHDDEYQSKILEPLKVNANKSGRYIQIDGTNRISCLFDCDRCAESFEETIDVEFSYLLHLGSLKNADQDEIIEIAENQKIIDMSEYYREASIIAVPFSKLCRDDCKGLCHHCGANLNNEECNCSGKQKEQDPRWDALRDLMKNNKS